MLEIRVRISLQNASLIVDTAGITGSSAMIPDVLDDQCGIIDTCEMIVLECFSRTIFRMSVYSRHIVEMSVLFVLYREL